MLVLLLAASPVLKAQQDQTYPAAGKVDLCTDRALYIAGEKVFFLAFLSSFDQKQPELSKILYAEIVSPDGKSVTRSKFALLNSAADGCLAIPKDIITGVYYLKAYTKYMRNTGPQGYAYVPIKIVNPLRSDVVSGNDTTGFAKDQENKGNDTEAFIISTERKEYAPREIVNVSVMDAGAAKNGRLCVSVVPEASASGNMLKFPVSDHHIKSLRYYPETRDVSISGELRDNTSAKPVAGARINLSIIGKGRDFMAMQTDSAGRYFFSLPAYTGVRDLFLCAENTAESRPKILVDNDFCAVPVHLPSPVFKLTPAERTMAYNMALNARLGQVFDADSVPCTSVAEDSDRAFYGTPAEILSIDNYVQLPTLEEYFNELPTAVKVRKRHGEKYFKVLGPQAEMSFFDPLVMVDWVAMNDPAKILAIAPQNLARIEVVNQPYVKGDITYGGIVSIISKRGDFAGIDLPASGIFINYLFMADNGICTEKISGSPNIPDARNTLYWEPNLAVNAENRAGFSFTTPDTPGRYTVVMRGITRTGNTFRRTAVFEVKQGK